jgi:hypothetical protein
MSRQFRGTRGGPVFQSIEPFFEPRAILQPCQSIPKAAEALPSYGGVVSSSSCDHTVVNVNGGSHVDLLATS